MDSQDVVAIAFRFVECINRRDLDGLTGLMTEEHTFVDLEGDVEQGRDVMRKAWAGYFSAFPDYMIHVSAFFTVGDTVILVGRTTGSHLQLPRAVEFRDPVIWAARIVDDLVFEWRIYPDTQEARATLGIPTPGDALEGKPPPMDRISETGGCVAAFHG